MVVMKRVLHTPPWESVAKLDCMKNLLDYGRKYDKKEAHGEDTISSCWSFVC